MIKNTKLKSQEALQLKLQLEIVNKTGINIVTCGNCGSVLLHRIKINTICCHFCDINGDPCNFPDLNYE